MNAFLVWLRSKLPRWLLGKAAEPAAEAVRKFAEMVLADVGFEVQRRFDAAIEKHMADTQRVLNELAAQRGEIVVIRHSLTDTHAMVRDLFLTYLKEAEKQMASRGLGSPPRKSKKRKVKARK